MMITFVNFVNTYFFIETSLECMTDLICDLASKLELSWGLQIELCHLKWIGMALNIKHIVIGKVLKIPDTI